MKKILIVDDSITVRSSLQKIFTSAGYDVYTAVNGLDGFEKFCEIVPDLMTVDVDMPVLNGFELCTKIREHESAQHAYEAGIPLLFITSIDTIDGRIQGYHAGGTEFITKPFSPQDITEKVHSLLFPKKIFIHNTILVIEDSATARINICNILRSSGAFVIEAEDGETGLELLRSGDYSIDLILLDLVLPDMQGDDVCRIIREDLAYTEIPVVFLTVVSEKSKLVDIFYAGASDYITKPFIKEELISRMDVHLRSLEQKRGLQRNIQLKSDFISIVNHEIRTPMNGIMGMLDLFMMTEMSETQREYLEIIDQSSHSMMSVINDIVDFSRIEADEIVFENKFFSLKFLLKQVRQIFVHRLEKKAISMDIVINDEVPDIIHGDANRIKQVLFNLVSNAEKFTAKGSISITVNARTLPDNTCNYLFTVKDTGIGIKKEDHEKIFEKFTQVHRDLNQPARGTGLGLAISKKIIERMNGRIWVQSKPGNGAVFFFNLILGYSTNNQESSDDLCIASIPQYNARILLVEDNKVNQTVASRLLEKTGCTVDIAQNGIEGYQFFNASNYDMVFMDLGLPEMDGYESLGVIRENFARQHVPVIALTAYTTTEERDRCAAAGFNDFLSKPVTLQQICELLGKYL